MKILFLLLLAILPKKILSEDCYPPCVTCPEGNIWACLSCPDGYFHDLDRQSCYPCVKSCKHCSMPNTGGACTDCYDGYYHSPSPNSNEGECLKCSDENCISCTKESKGSVCEKCQEKYYVNNNNICEKCDDTCITCSGPNSNQCLKCAEGYYKPSFNEEEPQSCSKCDDLCKKCHGPNMEDCDECIDGYYKSGDRCRSCDPECGTCTELRNHCTSCKEGFYIDGTRCLQCADNCVECKGPEDYECSKCADGYALYSGVCQTCLSLTNGKCSKCKKDPNGYMIRCTECPPGYRVTRDYDNDDETIECEQCSDWPNCLKCDDDAQFCTECAAGFYPNGDGKCSGCDLSCLTCQESPSKCTSCREKFYLDKSTNQCIECSDNCLHCNSPTECTICNSTYYPVNGACTKCHESCQLCHDGTDACDECKIGYYFNQFHRCTKCTDNCNLCNATHCITCAENFYPVNGICQPCAEVCSHCNGPTVDDCTSCDDGFYYSELLGVCFKCNDACQICHGPESYQCTSCSTGFYLSEYGQGCYKCEFNCKECNSQIDCSECNEGFRLYQRDGDQDKDCQPCKDKGCKKCDSAVDQCTECIDGYYSSSKDANNFVKCAKCSSNCKKCNANQCTECKEGYFLQNGQCLHCNAPCQTCADANTCLTCIDGYLFDGKSSCTSKCIESCLTCEGTAFTCSSCHSGFFLSGSKCLRCSEGCTTCNIYENGYTECTSCVNGYYLGYDDNWNRICLPCPSNCATCINGQQDGCTSCKPGFFFSSALVRPSGGYTGECSSCDGEGHENCELCIENCNDNTNECDPIPTCTQCKDGFYLDENSKCSNCHSNCASCDGPGEKDCITCRDGLYLINDVCTQCSPECSSCEGSPTYCTSCQPGKYAKDGKCLSCGPDCAECKDDANYCTLCNNNKYSYKGKCYSSCYDVDEPVGANITTKECYKCDVLDNCIEYDDACQCITCQKGYYIVTDPVTSIEFCLPCQLENCAECSGSGRNDCTECAKGYYLYTHQNTNTKECKLCESPCTVCSSLTTCTECIDGYFSNSNTECEKCQSPCASCSGPGNETCTSCVDKFILNGTICIIPPDDCELNKHCEKDNTDGKEYLNYTVELPLHDGYSNEESGGAIRLINYGFTGESSTFNNCVSEKGGGGGIFIFNNIQDDKAKYEISLKNLTFRDCKAYFGAAVYIFSPSEDCPVTIESCNFFGNEIYSTGSSNNGLTGGSALYLTVKNCTMKDCKFSDNKGNGLIKVSENFGQLPESKLLQSPVNRTYGFLSISGCFFDSTDCTLFLSNERRMTKIEVNDCTFKGKLPNGVHFIDGNGNQNENLFISSCVFESDENSALNRRMISGDQRNHLLAYNRFSKKNKLQLSSFLVFPTLAVAALVVAAAIVMKRREENDHVDQNESLQA